VTGAERSVVVSRHALERAQERFGPSVEWRDIHADVVKALHAGRISCRVPRFAAGSLKRRRAHHSARYVWTESERRLYVLVPYRRDAAWKVLTSIAPLGVPREALCPTTQAA
jgi:hypothetical protein